MLAFGLRPHPIRLPVAHGRLPQAHHDADRALVRMLLGDPVPDARTRPRLPALLAALPRLLPEPEPSPLRQDAQGPPPRRRSRGLEGPGGRGARRRPRRRTVTGLLRARLPRLPRRAAYSVA